MANPNQPATEDEQWRIIAKWLGIGSLNLFGLPLAGKDTQCRRLAAHFDAVVISGGDILRQRSDIPVYVRTASEQGAMAPTNEFLQIAIPYLSRPEFASRPLILSAVGRWHGEEAAITEAAKAAGHSLRAAIFLIIGEDEARQRLKHIQAWGDRGVRADDTADIFERRIIEFRDKTLPVLNYYRSRNLLIEVDGSGSVDAVETAILGKLYKKVTNRV